MERLVNTVTCYVSDGTQSCNYLASYFPPLTLLFVRSPELERRSVFFTSGGVDEEDSFGSVSLPTEVSHICEQQQPPRYVSRTSVGCHSSDSHGNNLILGLSYMRITSCKRGRVLFLTIFKSCWSMCCLQWRMVSQRCEIRKILIFWSPTHDPQTFYA